MKANFPDMKKRVLDFIRENGSRGATRTQLMQRFQVRTSDLDLVLAPLLTDHRIKQIQDPRRRALGRPAMRFYSAEVELELTPETKPATTPILAFGATPARSSSCQTCGVAIPLPEVGRPHVYCSEKCRRAARDGDGLPTCQDLLRRAPDPRVRARVGLCLVLADLCIRGFQVATDFFGPTTRLLVHDGTGAAWLDVLVIPDSGFFADPNTYESVALVYRSGQILYAGRQPLVKEEPAPLEAQPTGEKDHGSEADGSAPGGG